MKPATFTQGGGAGSTYRQEAHVATAQSFNDAANHTIATLNATNVPTGLLKVTWQVFFKVPAGGATLHLWVEQPAATKIPFADTPLVPQPSSTGEYYEYSGSFCYTESVGGSLTYLLQASAGVGVTTINIEWTQIVVEK